MSEMKIRNCAVRNIRRPGAVKKRIIMATAIPTAMGMAGKNTAAMKARIIMSTITSRTKSLPSACTPMRLPQWDP